MTRPVAGTLILLTVLALGACTARSSPVEAAAPAASTLPAARVVKEVASPYCIRTLDEAEKAFTHLAEALRGLQAQVDALLIGDSAAYLLARARYEDAFAKVPSEGTRRADATACRELANVPTAAVGVVEITPPSCIRSLEHFARALVYLSEASDASQAQLRALLANEPNAYLSAKTRYAEAFAKIRGVDTPLRADHTDCRAKASA